MAKKTKPQTKNEQADIKEPAKQESAKPYTIAQWKGMPLYQCKLCAFDTLSGDDILRHIQSVHFPPKPKRRANVLVANKSGEEVGAATGEAIEVELEEVSRTKDEQGNEHVEYTLKE